MTLSELTDKQLIRLFYRVLFRIKKWAEGDPFGWDLPTLSLCRPALAKTYLAVRNEGRQRRI